MGSYITFDTDINKLYKYLWFYVITKLISEYLFGKSLPENIKISYLKDLKDGSSNILVQETFNNIGITIFSLILWKYKPKFNTKIPISSTQNRHSSISLIYNEKKNNIKGVNCVFFFLIVFLLFLSKQLNKIFNIIDLKGLDYWMFEIIFICFISVNIFKVSIYIHKKVAIFIIIIFSTSMKFISTLYIIKDNTKKKLYKDYKWIIPIGIISFILIIFIRGYSYCRLKWLFDLKYISEIKLLIIYGIIGSIFSLISSLISTIIPCIDKNVFITYFCRIERNNKYYFDNFLIFFQDLWENEKKWINCLFILIKIFLLFLSNLFMVLIIKNLSPEYLIFSKDIIYFIIELTSFIFSIFDRIDYSIFNLLTELFAILGVFIYLEIIELNFCGLNFYLRKNIIRRSKLETNFEIINSSINFSNSISDNDSRTN